MSGYGPTLPRHTLNVAGSVFLPKGFELTMNMAYIMRLPVNPTVPNLFLPGTVPTSTSGAEPIPDLAFNCLAITCGKAQFASAVANFKSTIGAPKTPRALSFRNWPPGPERSNLPAVLSFRNREAHRGATQFCSAISASFSSRVSVNPATLPNPEGAERTESAEQPFLRTPASRWVSALLGDGTSIDVD